MEVSTANDPTLVHTFKGHKNALNAISLHPGLYFIKI